MLPFGGTMGHYGAYKHEVGALLQVQAVGTSISSLYTGMLYWLQLKVPGKTAPMNLEAVAIDSSLIRLLGLKWEQAPLTGSSWYDENHLILNQAAVQEAGLAGEIVGQRVEVGGKPKTMAGVLKNFNFNSLRERIKPFGVMIVDDPDKVWGTGFDGCLYVKIGAHANVPTVIEAIKKIYAKYDQRTPFEFQFLDEAFNNDYKMEDRLAGLMGAFTLVTIVIACLGLFALATFAAQQRMREIGIRKVLGASVASIGALLSKDFLRPVLLAIGIACPVAWWVMHKWLEDFAYRTTLSWWIFGGAGIGLVLVALGTVLSRSLRAGRANPVENLRAE
jgi:putative ABC transport system permease protein